MAGGRIWAAFNHMSPNTPPACQLLHTRWTSKLLLSHRGRHDGASGPGLPPTNSPRTTCSILSLSSRVFERQNSRKPLSAPLHTRALSRNVQLLRGPSPHPPPCSGLYGCHAPHCQYHMCVELILAILIRKLLKQPFFFL